MNIDKLKSVIRPLTVLVYNESSDAIESLRITANLADLDVLVQLTQDEFFRTETENDEDGDFADSWAGLLWEERNCKIVGIIEGHVPAIVAVDGFNLEQMAFTIAYEIGVKENATAEN